jgi:hypothetical protein
LQSGFCGLRIQFREVDPNPALGVYALQGLAVFNRERGSQYLVPSNDFIKAVFQSRRVQRSTKTITDRQVVGRIARRYPIDHPHLELKEGKGREVLIWPSGYDKTFRSSLLLCSRQAVFEQGLLFRRKT